MNATAIGLSIVLAAGAIGSATLLPMKFIRTWKWEQSWLLYSLAAYAVFPIAMACLTVPGLSGVYGAAGGAAVAKVALFGLGWGLSVVLLGLAVAAAGLAVSNAVILGCSISLGSLVPLLMHDPAKLLTGDGLRILAANALLLGGVISCAAASHLRDRGAGSQGDGSQGDGSQGASSQGASSQGDGLRLRGGGLVLCFVAGVLTPLLNIALAAGEPITQQALEAGAPQHQAANAVWGLAVGCGSIPSILYCLALLRRNRSWQRLGQPTSWVNSGLCCGMATLFVASTIGYGSGALEMGTLGPVIGWPVYISSLLIGNAFWGWLTGEWRGAPRRAGNTMLAGIGLQVAGILTLFLVGSA